MKLIGFIGFMGSGKTTAADYLVSKGYEKVNFKDALVTEIKDNFPDLLQEILQDMPKEITVDYLFQLKPPLMRALMQNYGTEVRRRDDPDYWTKRWQAAAMLETRAGIPVVVDDVRFQNEAEAVKRAGGVLIRLERTDVTTGGNHASEKDLADYPADYTISVGPGELEKMYQEIDKLI